MRHFLFPTPIVAFVLVSILSGMAGQVVGQTRPTSAEVTTEKKLIEGKKFTMLGNWEKAEAIFKAILQEDVNNSAACYELSRTLAAMGQTTEALSYIRKAIRLEPDNEWYLLMEADIHEISDDMHATMEVYDRLIQLRPEKEHYYEMQIQFCQKTGLHDHLLRVLDQHEKNLGITEFHTRIRFETLDELGRKEEALAAIDKLTRIFPYNLEYKFVAAAYARKTGMEDHAVTYYKSVLLQDPDNARAKLALAGTQKEAIAPADYLQSIGPVMTNPALDLDVKLQELLPYVLDFAESKDKTIGQALINMTEQLSVTHPQEAKIYALRGDILSIQGKYSDAIEAYTESTKLNGSVYLVWEQLVGLQMHERVYDDLFRTSMAAMDIFPNQAYLYYAAGYARYKLRDFDQALDMLNEALIMTGRNMGQKISVYVILGLVYDELGDLEKSSQAFEAALSLDPKKAETLAYYSLALSRRITQSEKAVSMTEKAMAQQDASPLIHEILAQVFYHQAKYPEALTSIQKAIEPSAHSEVFDLAGDILMKMGQTEEAVGMWEKALEAGVEDVDIRKKIMANKAQ